MPIAHRHGGATVGCPPLQREAQRWKRLPGAQRFHSSLKGDPINKLLSDALEAFVSAPRGLILLTVLVAGWLFVSLVWLIVSALI